MTVFIVTGSIVSCQSGDHQEPRATITAPPGRFTTVIGTGPEGNPDDNSGWFEDPIDLTAVTNGSIFVLTKTNGRVFKIQRNGAYQQYSSLTEPGDALSIATTSDDSILVAQMSEKTDRLTVWQLRKGQTPVKIEEQPAPKNKDSVHLVKMPSGGTLLLKDGRLQRQSTKGTFESMPYPKGLASGVSILAATTDGSNLMLLLPTEFVWLDNNRVIRRLPVAEMDAHDGATITPDGSGGAFVARYGPAIDHYSPQDGDGSVLIGYGGVTGCGKGHVSGTTGNARDQNFSRVTSLLKSGSQLYFTDPDCHRVLAIGMPPREFHQ